MGIEAEPRKELLGLVRALAERIRLDEELRKPLSYLTHGNSSMVASVDPQTMPSSSLGGNAAVLEKVRMELGDCCRCTLSGIRHRIVFGEGNPGADLVFVGEAPGADEDEQGRPFVGRRGSC